MATELEVLYAKRRANIMKAYSLSEQAAEIEKQRKENFEAREKLDNEIIRVRNAPIIVGS